MNSSLQAMTLRLIAGCSASILLVAALLMSWYTLEQGAQLLARTLVATIAAQAALIEAGLPLPEDVARQGVRWTTTPPPVRPPDTPLGRALAQEISSLQPDWQVRVQDHPEPQISARLHAGQWVVVPFKPLSASVLRASFWILGATTILVILAATWLTRRIGRPLSRLVTQADALLDGRLDHSSFADAPREVAALAATLADAAMARRRQQTERQNWLAGLSHDLRTPLARLRFAVELDSARDLAAQSAIVADIEEMDELVGQFISLIREGRDEAPTPFDLAELVLDVADRFARRAHIEVIGAVSEWPMHGRAFALRRALGNLVQNAIVHGTEPVAIALERIDANVVIRVSNAARSDGEPGAQGFGLGLSVVRMVASMFGGRFDIEHHADGRTTATLVLPTSPIPEHRDIDSSSRH